MNGRLVPLLDLALVTPLLAVYGSTPWAWLGGPFSAAVIWAFRWRARRPLSIATARAEPAPSPTRLRRA